MLQLTKFRGITHEMFIFSIASPILCVIKTVVEQEERKLYCLSLCSFLDSVFNDFFAYDSFIKFSKDTKETDGVIF